MSYILLIAPSEICQSKKCRVEKVTAQLSFILQARHQRLGDWFNDPLAPPDVLPGRRLLRQLPGAHLREGLAAQQALDRVPRLLQSGPHSGQDLFKLRVD